MPKVSRPRPSRASNKSGRVNTTPGAKRSLRGKRYVYIWADGVYFNVRLESPENKKQCVLVIMGATAEGTKELLAIQDGYRESDASWRELLIDMKHRGLEEPPCLSLDGLPPGGLGSKTLTLSKRRQVTTRCCCWSEIHQRRTRRLTHPPYTTFDNTSGREGYGRVVEELALPLIEDARLQFVLVAEIGDGDFVDQVSTEDGGFVFGAEGAAFFSRHLGAPVDSVSWSRRSPFSTEAEH